MLQNPNHYDYVYMILHCHRVRTSKDPNFAHHQRHCPRQWYINISTPDGFWGTGDPSKLTSKWRTTILTTLCECWVIKLLMCNWIFCVTNFNTEVIQIICGSAISWNWNFKGVILDPFGFGVLIICLSIIIMFAKGRLAHFCFIFGSYNMWPRVRHHRYYLKKYWLISFFIKNKHL